MWVHTIKLEVHINNIIKYDTKGLSYISHATQTPTEVYNST